MAFVAEKTAGDGDGMIPLLEDKLAGDEAGSPLEVLRAALTSISGDVLLGNAVDDGTNSRPHARTRAHCAGLVRRVQHEIAQVSAITAGHVFEGF